MYLPKSIGSVEVDNVFGIRVVLQTLAHLLSISSEDQTGYNQVLPWRSVEQMCSENQKGVEPSSSLIDTFRNEIGGESVVELFVGEFEGVVLLSVRHAEISGQQGFLECPENSPSRFEPTVKDLFNSL
jgi:hypothetical protein